MPSTVLGVNTGGITEMKKSSLYTKKGDTGGTEFFNGAKTAKCNILLHTCGHLDELNSLVGLLLGHFQDDFQKDRALLIKIQGELLTMGACLMTTQEQREKMGISPENSDLLLEIEERIDSLDTHLPLLKNFILPGGNPGASTAHVCRCVCRRAERSMARAAINTSRENIVSGTMQAMINRLSDYFFVLARSINAATGTRENIWKR